MKLEPNMYVRTLFGIKKIDHIDNKKTVWKYLYKINDDNEFYALSDNDVIKASNNIIDLIEAGDYVNGMKVMDADWCNEEGDYEEGLAFPMYASDDLDIIENWQPLKYVKIKSIVTKQQFSSMEYRLGE